MPKFTAFAERRIVGVHHHRIDLEHFRRRSRVDVFVVA